MYTVDTVDKIINDFSIEHKVKYMIYKYKIKVPIMHQLQHLVLVELSFL